MHAWLDFSIRITDCFIRVCQSSSISLTSVATSYYASIILQAPIFQYIKYVHVKLDPEEQLKMKLGFFFQSQEN